MVCMQVLLDHFATAKTVPIAAWNNVARATATRHEPQIDERGAFQEFDDFFNFFCLYFCDEEKFTRAKAWNEVLTSNGGSSF